MDQVIAKIKKKGNSEIWIRLNTYNGKDRIDVREYYKSSDNPEFFPTRKGVSVTVENLSSIKELFFNLQTATTIGTYGYLDLFQGFQIQANQKEYNNHLYNELRVYYQDSETNEWKPTIKGVTFNPALTEQIVEAIDII